MGAQASPFVELSRLSFEIATLTSVTSLLNWDQETYMPPAGAGHRAEQQSMLAALTHQRKTSPRVGELIAACEKDRALTGDPAAPAAAAVREFRRDFDLAT